MLKNRRDIYSMIRYTSKILFGTNYIVALLVSLFTIVLFNLEQVSYAQIARIGETYLVLIGIISLTFIINIEKNVGAIDITLSKQFSNIKIYLLRYFITSIYILLTILIPIVIAKIYNSPFPLIEVILGIYITVIFYGTLGLTVANIFSNDVAGYLLAFAYFIMEQFSKGKYTKSFYSLGLICDGLRGKFLLLTLCVVLIIVNYLILNIKERAISDCI